jgi:drug/metabolite transporter (DMT)-like permease
MLSDERGAATRAPAPAFERARAVASTVGGRLSLAAVTCQVIWAFNVTAMKYTVSQLDPYLVGMLRALFAGVILLAILRLTEGSVGIARRHWPLMALVAFVGMGINTICWQNGLHLATATNASLIGNVSPIFALIFAVLLGQEHLSGRRLSGMLVAFGGVVLIVNPAEVGLHPETLLGDLLLIGSSFTWALYNVLSVRLLVNYSPLRVTTWTLLGGAVSMLFMSPFGVRSWETSPASGLAWLGLAYAVVFAATIAQTLWSRTVHRLGASATMIYAYLNPLLVVVFAALMFGERLTLPQAGGAALVFGGVALTSGRRRVKL